MAIRPATHRARGQARRAALLEAAIEVIAEHGVDGVTHRLVAARAQMPLSTTSYFFASLDDLLAAALDIVADRLAERVADRITALTSTGLAPEDTIEPLVDLLLSSPVSDIVAQFEIYLSCARRPTLQAAAHQLMTSIERSTEAALAALGVDQPAARGPMVVAMLDGFALHRRAWPRAEADRQRLTTALTSLLHGFQLEDQHQPARPLTRSADHLGSSADGSEI